jgi:hypothetical protein
VINAGGRWIVDGREITVFEGRLIPKYPAEPTQNNLTFMPKAALR